MADDLPDILAENLLEDATITSATEDDVYVADYVADRSRLSKFMGDGTATQSIVFDLGSAQAVDTFVLDKAWVITGGSASLKLQYSDTGAWGGEETTALTLSAADMSDNTLPVWKVFASVSKRYWRVLLENLTAAPTIFGLWMGTRVQLNMAPVGDFDPWQESTVDTDLTATTGATQVVHHFKKRKMQAAFQGLTDTLAAQLDSLWDDAISQGKPWWFLWKPDGYVASPSATTAPVLYVSPNMTRALPYSRATRSGYIEGSEV